MQAHRHAAGELEEAAVSVAAEGGLATPDRYLARLLHASPPTHSCETLLALARSGTLFDTPTRRSILLYRLEAVSRASLGKELLDIALRDAGGDWHAPVDDAMTLASLPLWFVAARAGLPAPVPEAAAWRTLFASTRKGLAEGFEAMLEACATRKPVSLDDRLAKGPRQDPAGRPTWLHVLAWSAFDEPLSQGAKRFLRACTTRIPGAAWQPGGRVAGDYLLRDLDRFSDVGIHAQVMFMRPPGSPGWAGQVLAPADLPELVQARIPEWGAHVMRLTMLRPYHLWSMPPALAARLATHLEEAGIASPFTRRFVRFFALNRQILGRQDDYEKGYLATTADCVDWSVLAPAMSSAIVLDLHRWPRAAGLVTLREKALAWLGERLPPAFTLSQRTLGLLEMSLYDNSLDPSVRSAAAGLLASASATRLAAGAAARERRRA